MQSSNTTSTAVAAAYITKAVLCTGTYGTRGWARGRVGLRAWSRPSMRAMQRLCRWNRYQRRMKYELKKKDSPSGLPAEGGGVISDIAGIIVYSVNDCMDACSRTNSLAARWNDGIQCRAITFSIDLHTMRLLLRGLIVS
jgi:hypothetical protein